MKQPDARPSMQPSMRSPMQSLAQRPMQPGAPGPWHRQPILWLGALVLVASLAGCLLMIALALRHADVPVPIAGGEVMKIPLARPAVAPRPADAP
jgi:hypothetical protein